MNTVKLYNGVEMPMVGYGTYKVTDEKECIESVACAARTGYRLFDTAQLYRNEEVVGKAIAQCGVPRKDLFITTKVWITNYEAGICRASVEESLRKMNLNYFDMVLLHWPFGNTYAAWRDLEALYEEGKIRAIGVSNFSPARMIDLIQFNKIKPMVNQIETHLYCQQKEAHQWLTKYGVAHQAYSPLGQGKANEMFAEPFVKEIAKAHGKTETQILLRLLIQSGVAIIPKSSHEERIRQNYDLFDFELTEKEMEKLQSLDRALPLIGTPEDPNKAIDALTW